MSLADFLLAHQDNLRVDICIKLIKLTAECISKLHEANIAHRDIRLENIAVRQSNRIVASCVDVESVKLTGFDLAICFEKDTQEVR